MEPGQLFPRGQAVHASVQLGPRPFPVKKSRRAAKRPPAFLQPRHLQPQEPPFRPCATNLHAVHIFSPGTGHPCTGFFHPLFQVSGAFHCKRHILSIRINRPRQRHVFFPPSCFTVSVVTLPHGFSGSRPVAYFIRLTMPSPAGFPSGAESASVPSK